MIDYYATRMSTSVSRLGMVIDCDCGRLASVAKTVTGTVSNSARAFYEQAV